MNKTFPDSLPLPSLLLPDEEALCPLLVPPSSSDKFHINSGLIHSVSPRGRTDSPYPDARIASRSYSRVSAEGEGRTKRKKGTKKVLSEVYGDGITGTRARMDERKSEKSAVEERCALGAAPLRAASPLLCVKVQLVGAFSPATPFVVQ